MRDRYWLGGVKVLVLAAAAVLMIGTASAQPYKYLPTLSLVKLTADPAGNPADVTQRDTIYVAEATPGDRRYFLLPVFYKNNLDSITNGTLTAEPIYSFRFKLQYNRTMMRAIGVQRRGVLPLDTNVGAKNFNLSWDVDRDSTYKLSTEGSASAYGERIMIEGSSATPLPRPKRFGATGNSLIDLKQDVLLYVLFEIIAPTDGAPGVGISTDRLILTPDSIQWNNYVTSNPFTQLPGRNYTVPPSMIARGFDPNPQTQVGIEPAPIIPLTYPNKYGQAVLSITRRPIIRLLSSSPLVPVAPINGDSTNYELVMPMQTYFGNLNFIFRNIIIRNNTPNSILRYVTVETDQPWLRVDTNDINNVTPGTRLLEIREIPETQLNFNVIANPNLLPTTDGSNYPTPGIYVGYVSIRSTESGNSVLRLRVTLIVTRNPLESGLVDSVESTRPFGIQLLFRNSAPSPDSTYLFFGTGLGATDRVDTLFGELEGNTPPPFYARFFPPSVLDSNPAFRGLVDGRGIISQLSNRASTNGESSLDVRGFNALSTLLYCIRFSAGTSSNYPVVFEYDTRDFPNGSQLYFRDTLNGGIFVQNLRSATSLGGTRRAFFIRDPNINSICIEYTLPSLVQFPSLNIGWNFVSLPVRPSDPRSGVIFGNIASGKPLNYASGMYLENDTVRAGVGYFVKYQSQDAINRDRRIAGVPIRRIPISGAPEDSVKIYGGWNTVGALSVPTSIDNMRFVPIPGGVAPVRIGEMYRYATDSGYIQSSILIPGFGYWIKVSGEGYYELTAPAGAFGKAPAVSEEYRALNRMTVSSADQKVASVWFGQTGATFQNERFELPPAMRGMFDVRFNNNAFVSGAKEIGAERTLSIQGVQYPVVLTVDRSDANYTITDAETGRVLGTLTQGTGGTITITDPSVTMVKLVGNASAGMNLGEAVPNPVGSTLNFTVNAPADEMVKVTLHSALGAEVATLFDGSVDGQAAVNFNTDGLASGVYYYKMTTSSGYSAIRQVVIAR